MTVTSRPTELQPALSSRRPSFVTTIGIVLVVVAVAAVLLISSLTTRHHSSTHAPLGTITPLTAEGRAAAEQVPPGLLGTTPLTAEGRAAAELVPPGLLGAAGGTGTVCKPTRVVQVC